MQPARSTRGPRALTVLGVVVLLGALVAGSVAVVLVVRALPTGVVGPDGGPGPDVVAVVEPGREARAELTAGAYHVWSATPARGAGDGDATSDGASGGLPDGARDVVERIRVTDPAGDDDVPVRRGWLSGTSRNGRHLAVTVAGFDTSRSGTHVLHVPSLPGTDDAHLLLTADRGAATFVGAVLGTVAAVMAALVLAAVGLGLALGGGVWWYRRAHPPAPLPPR